MNAAESALRLFVAMPGTDMGEHAQWQDIDEIKRHLLAPIAARLGKELHRPVKLDIETDKPQGGNIYRSMFSEAIEADIYIADLSGDNPNVFLELGVRWALADNTTILITQDPDDKGRRFNVASARAIRYGQGPAQLERAIDKVVAAARSGLGGHVDSVVREHLDVVPVNRAVLLDLQEQIRTLEAQRGDDLVIAAQSADAEQALQLLRRAVDINPASFQAWYELGVRSLRIGAYPEASQYLERATGINESDAEAWRELGVARSKGGLHNEAAEAFERSLALDARNSESWANLAGLYRRIARSGDPAWDYDTLLKSAECYDKASALSGNDTYPRVNAAKVKLLLASDDGSATSRHAVEADFGRLKLLAEFTIKDLESRMSSGTIADHTMTWKYFDLVDCLLMTGPDAEAAQALDRALDSVPPGETVAVVASVVEPWQDFLAAGVLDQDQAARFQRAIDTCEAASA